MRLNVAAWAKFCTQSETFPLKASLQLDRSSMVRFLVSAGAVLLGAASVTGFGTSPIALPARAGLQCVSRGQSARAGPTLGLRMQWSPEERQRREEARKAREAKILREREERQVNATYPLRLACEQHCAVRRIP